MTLDPKVRELLDLRADAPPIGTVPVDVMRDEAPAQMAELFRMWLVSTPVAAVAERAIPGLAADLPVRAHTPEGRGPFPLVASSTAAAGYSATSTPRARSVGRCALAPGACSAVLLRRVHHLIAKMVGILDQAGRARDEMCAWLRGPFRPGGQRPATGDGAAPREGSPAQLDICEKGGDRRCSG